LWRSLARFRLLYGANLRKNSDIRALSPCEIGFSRCQEGENPLWQQLSFFGKWAYRFPFDNQNVKKTVKSLLPLSPNGVAIKPERGRN